MYDFSKYGRNITNEDIATKISEDLEKICCDDKQLELDFGNVDLLTTTCVKLIFSPVITKYGKDDFLKNIIFMNTNRNLQLIISHGIENLIEEKNTTT